MRQRNRLTIEDPYVKKTGLDGRMPESNKSGNSKREAFASFMTYGTLGLEMGLSVAIGLAIGYYLDRYFKTAPILTLVFLVFGLVAGMKRLYELWKKAERESQNKDDTTGKDAH
jgi:ATP synthase protein I